MLLIGFFRVLLPWHTHCRFQFLKLRFLGVLMRISKSQFNRAIEGDSEQRLSTKRYVVTPVSVKPKHAMRTILTVLVMLIGIATGWVAGRGLNGHSPAANPETDAATMDASTQLPPPEAQQHSKPASGVAAASRPTPESAQPPAVLQPPETQPEQKEAPPKPTKVDPEAGPDAPAPEDPVKDIGRQALEKMSKDVKKMRRTATNKNEN